MALVITRKPGQSLSIDGPARVRLGKIAPSQVKLEIEADPGVAILREELTRRPADTAAHVEAAGEPGNLAPHGDGRGDRGDDWISTRSGRQFWPMAPRPDDLDLGDIAHALAHQCRYNGHCRRYYSVAEHCVLMAGAVDRAHRLTALLHDAAEAYLGDMVRPIKHAAAFARRWVDARGRRWTAWQSFATVEDRLLEMIARRFGAAWPLPEAIHHADLRMLATERLQLFGADAAPWAALEGVAPYPMLVRCWSPTEAKTAFLEAWDEYTTVRHG